MKNIAHSGTKGMKWGRRLYQNKDGSLTPLGRIRYRKGSPKGASPRKIPEGKKIRTSQSDKTMMFHFSGRPDIHHGLSGGSAVCFLPLGPTLME